MADKSLELQGRAALVTGAGSGIGAATARLFASEGASVALAGRRLEPLREIAEEIAKIGGRAHPIIVDLMTDEGPERAIKETVAAFGNLDILVNSAGALASGTIENTTMQAWDDLMRINVRSVFELMQKAVPHLAERRGNIVNISSVAGPRIFPGVLAYCVSKAALDQLTRCAALELAPQGIRVNAVNPGVVATGLHRKSGMDEEAYQAFLERSKTTHPIGRTGTAEEIADLVLFLASEKSGWITGATYIIDGGRVLTCAR